MTTELVSLWMVLACKKGKAVMIQLINLQDSSLVVNLRQT